MWTACESSSRGSTARAPDYSGNRGGAKWVAQRDLALSLCRDLDLVLVVDPFVTPPEPGQPVYWRLHGITGPRHTYTDDELNLVHRMLVDAADPDSAAYIMFNEMPRVGDAKRFSRILEAAGIKSPSGRVSSA